MSAPPIRYWKEAETMVARWLQENGYPDAKTTRSVDNGRQSTSGDITGTPFVVEVKAPQPHRSTSWPKWCRQAALEADGGAFIVVKRVKGNRDVGSWPARWVVEDGVDYSPTHAAGIALMFDEAPFADAVAAVEASR